MPLGCGEEERGRGGGERSEQFKNTTEILKRECIERGSQRERVTRKGLLKEREGRTWRQCGEGARDEWDERGREGEREGLIEIQREGGEEKRETEGSWID